MRNTLLAACAALAILVASCSKSQNNGLGNLLGKTKKNSDIVQPVIGGGDDSPKPPVDTSGNGGGDTPQDPACEDVYCTLDLRLVSLAVVDANGNAILLDDAYTEDANGNRLPAHLYGFDEHLQAYVVLNDAWVHGHQNTTATLRFVGVKNGVKVVTESYLISSDCCHIAKQSGKDKVVL